MPTFCCSSVLITRWSPELAPNDLSTPPAERAEPSTEAGSLAASHLAWLTLVIWLQIEAACWVCHAPIATLPPFNYLDRPAQLVPV